MKDRETWHAVVHGVTKSWTWLSNWTTITDDLQCCVSFRCTAKWFNYTFASIYSFSNSFPIWLTTECWVEFPVLYRTSLLIKTVLFFIQCSSRLNFQNLFLKWVNFFVFQWFTLGGRIYILEDILEIISTRRYQPLYRPWPTWGLTLCCHSFPLAKGASGRRCRLDFWLYCSWCQDWNVVILWPKSCQMDLSVAVLAQSSNFTERKLRHKEVI